MTRASYRPAADDADDSRPLAELRASLLLALADVPAPSRLRAVDAILGVVAFSLASGHAQLTAALCERDTLAAVLATLTHEPQPADAGRPCTACDRPARDPHHQTPGRALDALRQAPASAPSALRLVASP
jgi:hypothetical protein